MDNEVQRQVTLLTLLVALHLLVFSEARIWMSKAQAVHTMRQWYPADTTVLDVLRRVTIASRALPPRGMPWLPARRRWHAGRLRQPATHRFRCSPIPDHPACM